jgi:hypothetical protein
MLEGWKLLEELKGSAQWTIQPLKWWNDRWTTVQ